jgi:thiamine kinase-like enzyme
MKISTLIEREPFKKLFKVTIEDFLVSKTNIKHQVQYDYQSLLGKKSQVWLCNPLINSIFIQEANSDIFSSINGEYSYNPHKPWKSIAQKIYLRLSQSKFTAARLAKYKISISPPIQNPESKLFIGGNTKIRLLDTLNKEVFVILKKGFNKQFIEKELYVKKNFRYLPTPNIIDHGVEGSWYSEEYIQGIPPNRLPAEIGKVRILEAIECLKKLYSETSNTEYLHDYVLTQSHNIKNQLKDFKNASTEVISSIDYIVSKIVKNLMLEKNAKINLAYCHGDFHQGNILSGVDKFWILDWEYSGVKHISYDLIIFLLDTRIEDGFSDRFINIINNKINKFQLNICSNWPGIDWSNTNSRKIYLLIFLLDDLIFHISESSNSFFYKKDDVLKMRCNEICNIIEHTL